MLQFAVILAQYRAHASTEGASHHVDHKVAGFLLEKGNITNYHNNKYTDNIIINKN